MFCYTCNQLSLEIICKECQKRLLQPQKQIKKLDCDLEVISFYSFEEVQMLISSKYYPFGSRIYQVMAKNSFKVFAKNFEFDEKIYAISIDDNLKKGYSHTAILANALKSQTITPYFSKLIAKNDIKYAGQTLEFRKTHKKNFEYKGKNNIDVILVDDVVTTGTTIKEAKELLKKYNVNVVFCVALVDKRW